MPIKTLRDFNGKKEVVWVPDPKRRGIAGKELKRLLRKVVARKIAIELKGVSA